MDFFNIFIKLNFFRNEIEWVKKDVSDSKAEDCRDKSRGFIRIGKYIYGFVIIVFVFFGFVLVVNIIRNGFREVGETVRVGIWKLVKLCEGEFFMICFSLYVSRIF